MCIAPRLSCGPQLDLSASMECQLLPNHGRMTPCALRLGSPVGRARPEDGTPARLSNREERLPPAGAPST